VSGFTSESLFYKSQEQHELKLKSFARYIAQLPADQNVLDIGCGYGELLRFAKPLGEYVGIDLVWEFVTEARRRYPGERFAVTDVFSYVGPAPDWALLVGVLSSVPTPEAVLSRAAELARKGIIFDITLEERLPADYVDLFRWSREEVQLVMRKFDLVITETYDAGATWVIFRAERRPLVERERMGSSLGGE